MSIRNRCPGPRSGLVAGTPKASTGPDFRGVTAVRALRCGDRSVQLLGRRLRNQETTDQEVVGVGFDLFLIDRDGRLGSTAPPGQITLFLMGFDGGQVGVHGLLLSLHGITAMRHEWLISRRWSGLQRALEHAQRPTAAKSDLDQADETALPHLNQRTDQFRSGQVVGGHRRAVERTAP